MADGRALIGFTGFVGGNLLRQEPYDALYNSSNIETIRGRSFRHVVCAGVSAVKWWANQHPNEDRQGVDRLIEPLREVAADRFTLISTVDIYADTTGMNEDDIPDRDTLQPYGFNRRRLEIFVAERFSRHEIIRLPALFGPGLKKNAIFDLMHDNQIDLIHPDSEFQWYPVARLADDLRRCEAAGISLLNIATEPVPMREICRRFFPRQTIGAAAKSAGFYRMQSRHAEAWGGSGGFLMSADEVLDSLALYLRQEQAAAQ